MFLKIVLISNHHVEEGLEILVWHWDHAVRKKVSFTRTSDIMKALRSRILQEFDEEIRGLNFRLYSLPYGFTDVNQRRRICDVNDLEAYLKELRNYDIKPPYLYIFNDPDDTSPEKLPEVLNAKSERRSSASRNSGNSDIVRIRDSSTCVFCGYCDNSTRETCHIYEVGDFNKPSSEGKKTMLMDLGIYNINSVANMLCLCDNCHHNFDRHLIGIDPSNHELIILEEIFDSTTQGGTLYSTLNGKVIKFNGKILAIPPQEVLTHRYNIFKARISEKGKSSLPSTDEQPKKKSRKSK
jgi:5-methylcytosine-specific restriction endonuclease McrA